MNRSTGEDVAVAIGTVRIRFSDSGTITPGEARKLAAGLIELANHADAATAVYCSRRVLRNGRAPASP